MLQLPRASLNGSATNPGKPWVFRVADKRAQDAGFLSALERAEKNKINGSLTLSARHIDAPARVELGQTAHWRLKITNDSSERVTLRRVTAAPRRRELEIKADSKLSLQKDFRGSGGPRLAVLEGHSSSHLPVTFGPAKRYGKFRTVHLLEFEAIRRGSTAVKSNVISSVCIDVSPPPEDLLSNAEDDPDALQRGHDGSGVWDGQQRTVIGTIPPQARKGLGLHIHTPEDVDWQRRLPMYEIPEDIQTKVDETGKASGFCPWLKRDDNAFKNRLHALLWTEEAQLIKNFRKYDIANATFVPEMNVRPEFSKVLHRLEVPGLAERRPSLLKGDLVYAWQPDTCDVEYEGWIAAVEQTTILVAFAEIFREHYQNHLAQQRLAAKQAQAKDVQGDDATNTNDDNIESDPKKRCGFHVRFTFPRIEHRRMHMAVDNVSLDLLWPNIHYPLSIREHSLELDWNDKSIPQCMSQKESVLEIVSLSKAAERLHAASNQDESLTQQQQEITKKGRGAELLPAFLAAGVKTSQASQLRTHKLRHWNRPPPFILSGAFGTGKTRTMVEAIWQVINTDPEARLLVCSETNSAADLVVEKLAEVLKPNDMLRLVHSHRSPHSIPKDVLPYAPYSSEKNIFLTPALNVLVGYKVIVSTMMNSAVLFGLGVPVDHFTHIFLEEAANALLPVALLPLTLASNGSCIVLVGDEKQVSPRVSSQSARFHGLEESLLTWYSRIRNEHHALETGAAAILKVELVENFRSHPLLLSLPSKLFYGDRLVSRAIGAPANCLERWKRLPKAGSPLLIVGVEGSEEQVSNSPSFMNKFEAAECVRLIVELLRDNPGTIKQEDVAVVTAFHLQTVHIRSLLRRKKLFGINVGGIQVLQGQERKAVFITTVRSRRQWLAYDRRHKLGFTFDEKKLNTALTRSIGLLVVIGDPYCLMEEPKWRETLELADAYGCYEGIPLHDDKYMEERKRREEEEAAADSIHISDEGFLTRLTGSEIDQDVIASTGIADTRVSVPDEIATVIASLAPQVVSTNDDAASVAAPSRSAEPSGQSVTSTGIMDKIKETAPVKQSSHIEGTRKELPSTQGTIYSNQTQQYHQQQITPTYFEIQQQQQQQQAPVLSPVGNYGTLSMVPQIQPQQLLPQTMSLTPAPLPRQVMQERLPFPSTNNSEKIIPLRELQLGAMAHAINTIPCPAFRSFVFGVDGSSGQSFLIIQVCTFGWQSNVSINYPKQGYHTINLARLPDEGENLVIDPAVGRGTVAPRASLVISAPIQYNPDIRKTPDVLEIRLLPPRQMPLPPQPRPLFVPHHHHHHPYNSAPRLPPRPLPLPPGNNNTPAARLPPRPLPPSNNNAAFWSY